MEMLFVLLLGLSIVLGSSAGGQGGCLIILPTKIDVGVCPDWVFSYLARSWTHTFSSAAEEEREREREREI